jgi:xylose isomerase
LIGEGATIAESEERLDAVVETIAAEMERTGKKLLWGTANLFSHRRYMHGAATSPDVDVYAHAGAQVRKAMEVAHRLGGGGYVFWGGREGYTTLLNTNMKRERDQLASFLHMAVAQKASMGFTGQLYIEPKPMEPTTHQYDSDAAACLNFLREFDLLDDFMLNVETNHATMAGHTMAHELAVATAAGHLGSIDANVGTPQVGWDTDRFPTDLVGATNIMLAVLGMGGFTTGGLNFDAKRRRESFEPVDIFHGHIAGMDTFARGLKIAAAIRADGRIQEFLDDRYVSWETPLGAKIMTGGCSLEELASHAATGGEPKMRSGRQELLEAIFNEHL